MLLPSTAPLAATTVGGVRGRRLAVAAAAATAPPNWRGVVRGRVESGQGVVDRIGVARQALLVHDGGDSEVAVPERHLALLLHYATAPLRRRA